MCELCTALKIATTGFAASGDPAIARLGKAIDTITNSERIHKLHETSDLADASEKTIEKLKAFVTQYTLDEVLEMENTGTHFAFAVKEALGIVTLGALVEHQRKLGENGQILEALVIEAEIRRRKKAFRESLDVSPEEEAKIRDAIKELREKEAEPPKRQHRGPPPDARFN